MYPRFRGGHCVCDITRTEAPSSVEKVVLATLQPESCEIRRAGGHWQGEEATAGARETTLTRDSSAWAGFLGLSVIATRELYAVVRVSFLAFGRRSANSGRIGIVPPSRMGSMGSHRKPRQRRRAREERFESFCDPKGTKRAMRGWHRPGSPNSAERPCDGPREAGSGVDG